MPDLALCCFATGRYASYLEGLAGTARRYLRAGPTTRLVTFTDQLPSPELAEIRLPVPHLPWPLGTLYRYRWITEAAEALAGFHYVFMCDVDMVFTSEVGPEILHDLVGVLHSGHLAKPWADLPFCRNRKSTAYLEPRPELQYHAGGFQGGARDHYLAACREMARRIDDDYQRGVVAEWHDETHWNTYLAEHPHHSLPPQYCWGQPDGLWPDTKILALDKEHQAIRE